MNELVTADLTTTSMQIAELFGREHKSVLRTIRGIIKDMSNDELRRRKIALTSCLVDMPNGGAKESDYFVIGEEIAFVIIGRLTGKKALDAQKKSPVRGFFIAICFRVRLFELIILARLLLVARLTRHNLKTKHHRRHLMSDFESLQSQHLLHQ